MIGTVTTPTTSSSRRVFLRQGAAVLAAAAWTPWRGAAPLAARRAFEQPGPRPSLRFALTTDVHFADKVAAGTRYYRDSMAKMRAAVGEINAVAAADPAGLAFAMTLGDFVDSAGTELTDETISREAAYVRDIEAEWSQVRAERQYVLGNHCVEALTKAEFFELTGARPAPYSFDVRFRGGAEGIHAVVLDACFTSAGEPYGRRNFDWRDTNVPAEQVAWLEADLASSRLPVLVFVHQRLDGEGDLFVNNAADVRSVLTRSGKVLAVFQGHSHQNALEVVDGIPYCVVRAMVEDAGPANNAFATVEIFDDLSIALSGRYRQSTYPVLAPRRRAR